MAALGAVGVVVIVLGGVFGFAIGWGLAEAVKALRSAPPIPAKVAP
jgi:hypothetical protein